MAGPRTCRSPCRNSPPGGEDERGLSGVLIKGNNIPTNFPAVFRAPTPTPPSTNELFKQFMKAYLESNQESSQLPEERKRLFKTKVPDLYYGKLHMDCYHFYQ